MTAAPEEYDIQGVNEQRTDQQIACYGVLNSQLPGYSLFVVYVRHRVTHIDLHNEQAPSMHNLLD